MAWRHRAALATAASGWFAWLSLRPLIESEWRYAEAAREMVASGDWVVPHLAYVPYLEKPILLYWLAAGSRLLFGDSLIALRLPSILAAAVALVITEAFGRAIGGRRHGLLAATLCWLCGGFALMGSVLTTDMVFATCLTGAWYAFWLHDRRDRRPWPFWLCVGLAWLAKGPLGAVLALGGIASYLLATRRRGRIAASRPISGIALVAAVNLPWSAQVWWRDPRLLEFFYLRVNFQAFFDGKINHAAPWFFYLPVVLAGTFPLSLPLVACAGAALWRSARATWARWRRPAAQAPDAGELTSAYLAGIVAFGLLFLSASASKLPAYILPLYPPLVLLALDGAGPIAASAAFRRLLLVQGLIVPPAAVAAVLIWWTNHVGDVRPDLAAAPVVVAGLVVLLAGPLIAAPPFLIGRWRSAMLRLAGCTAAGLAAAEPYAPRLLPDLDGGRLARVVRRLAAADDAIVLSTRCVQDYAIVSTIGRRLSYVGDVRELGFGHLLEVDARAASTIADPTAVNGENLPQNPWLLSAAKLDARWRGDGRCWLFTRPQSIEQMRKAGLEVATVDRTADIVLLTNHPLAGDPP